MAVGVRVQCCAARARGGRAFSLPQSPTGDVGTATEDAHAAEEAEQASRWRALAMDKIVVSYSLQPRIPANSPRTNILMIQCEFEALTA